VRYSFFSVLAHSAAHNEFLLVYFHFDDVIVLNAWPRAASKNPSAFSSDYLMPATPGSLSPLLGQFLGHTREVADSATSPVCSGTFHEAVSSSTYPCDRIIHSLAPFVLGVGLAVPISHARFRRTVQSYAPGGANLP